MGTTSSKDVLSSLVPSPGLTAISTGHHTKSGEVICGHVQSVSVEVSTDLVSLLWLKATRLISKRALSKLSRRSIVEMASESTTANERRAFAEGEKKYCWFCQRFVEYPCFPINPKGVALEKTIHSRDRLQSDDRLSISGC